MAVPDKHPGPLRRFRVFDVSEHWRIPFLFRNGVRFVYGSSGPAAGGVPMSSRSAATAEPPSAGHTMREDARTGRAYGNGPHPETRPRRTAQRRSGTMPCPPPQTNADRFVPFPAPHMNVVGRQMVVCRSRRHDGLPEQRIPVLALPGRARLAFPVVLHIGFAQALPERGDPFRRRVLRQQALPEAPEGSGVACVCSVIGTWNASGSIPPAARHPTRLNFAWRSPRDSGRLRQEFPCYLRFRRAALPQRDRLNTSSRTSMGLVRCAFIPAAKLRSSSPRMAWAVMARMGTLRQRASRSHGCAAGA